MRKSLDLVLAKVTQWNAADHPLVLPFGEFPEAVLEKERITIIKSALYWRLGFISACSNVSFAPLPDTIEVEGMIYNCPSIAAIGFKAHTVDLIAIYKR
jgi:hypothetical protein